jgi:hypothetical protein
MFTEYFLLLSLSIHAVESSDEDMGGCSDGGKQVLAKSKAG